MVIHVDADQHGPGNIEVIRQDGTREIVNVVMRSFGGMGCRAGSDFHLRRVSENPEVWECRCLLAILGHVHMCGDGEEVEDPFDEKCTANVVAGRGISKEMAVQKLCQELLDRVKAFWDE